MRGKGNRVGQSVYEGEGEGARESEREREERESVTSQRWRLRTGRGLGWTTSADGWASGHPRRCRLLVLGERRHAGSMALLSMLFGDSAQAQAQALDILCLRRLCLPLFLVLDARSERTVNEDGRREWMDDATMDGCTAARVEEGRRWGAQGGHEMGGRCCRCRYRLRRWMRMGSIWSLGPRASGLQGPRRHRRCTLARLLATGSFSLSPWS